MMQAVVLMVPFMMQAAEDLENATPALVQPLVVTPIPMVVTPVPLSPVQYTPAQVQTGPPVVKMKMSGGSIGHHDAANAAFARMVMDYMLSTGNIRLHRNFPGIRSGHFIGTGFSTDTRVQHARTATNPNYPELVYILSASSGGRRYTVTIWSNGQGSSRRLRR